MSPEKRNTTYSFKLIKTIADPTLEEKFIMLDGLIADFKDLMSYYDIPEYSITHNYPVLTINKLEINLIDFSYKGEHDSITDAFRDFVRRYGIRVYAPQGYKFNLNVDGNLIELGDGKIL